MTSHCTSVTVSQVKNRTNVTTSRCTRVSVSQAAFTLELKFTLADLVIVIAPRLHLLASWVAAWQAPLDGGLCNSAIIGVLFWRIHRRLPVPLHPSLFMIIAVGLRWPRWRRRWPDIGDVAGHAINFHLHSASNCSDSPTRLFGGAARRVRLDGHLIAH